MGELRDTHLETVTGPEELARATERARSDARAEVARRQRERAMAGNPAARADLAARFAAVTKNAPDPDALARRARP